MTTEEKLGSERMEGRVNCDPPERACKGPIIGNMEVVHR